MVRTATRRPRRKARRSYTPEEIAAIKERDAHVNGMADELMATPGAFGAKVAGLLPHGGPKLLSYSLSNQALLMTQATERGMTLREVNTSKAWRALGRFVRESEYGHGLFISRPAGRENRTEGRDPMAGKDGAISVITPAEVATSEDQDNNPVRYRMMTVYELSQTEGIEDFEGETQAVTDPPPALLFASLKTQAQRAGYTVTERPIDERGPLVLVNPEDATLTVYGDGSSNVEVIAQFAAVLTALTARAGKAGVTPPVEPQERVMTLTVV